MIILNFTHPLTPSDIDRIEEVSGQKVNKIIELSTQFDQELSFTDQVVGLIDSIGLSAEALQTAPLLVNLPALNSAAALVLTELHGRIGYFPTIIRMRPVYNSRPPRFEVAEIICLQAVRDRARSTR